MSARLPGILLLLIGCTAAAQALASVTASLDVSRVASGNTVQLTLERTGRTSGQPDVTPLEREFDILGTSSSTTYELFNGSASEKTQVVLTLAPKATGRLTIPALSWDGERSQPLALTVTGPGGAAQSGSLAATPAANVFIEDTTSPQRPYVEAAVDLTVRLFTSEPLYHADLELPDNSNFVVKQIGPDENGSVERNGRDYQVVTRRYLVFPLHSGRLTLEGPVLDAEIPVHQSRSPFGADPFGGGMFSGFLRTVQPVRVHGNPIVLTVSPRPPGAVGSYWLPARKVTLSAVWDPASLTAHAGDPVTLDLDLQATGLTAAQLPDLSTLLTFPSGLEAYPDQAKLHDSSRNGQLIGSRDQTIALMINSPGRYTIPALTVRWWDTRTNQLRAATLPARTLTILPVPGAAPAAGAAALASAPAAPATPPTPAAASAVSRHAPPATAASKVAPTRSPSTWEWISIGLAVAWLATLGGWLWSRRSRRPPSGHPDGTARAQQPPPANPAAADPAREKAAFRAACLANDASAARAHLLAWAGAAWLATPAGTSAVAARIGDTTVAALLRDLDRACYAGGSWQGAPLAAALTSLPPSADSPARARDGLEPLYP
jgi:hypothetical protein